MGRYIRSTLGQSDVLIWSTAPRTKDTVQKYSQNCLSSVEVVTRLVQEPQRLDDPDACLSEVCVTKRACKWHEKKLTTNEQETNLEPMARTARFRLRVTSI